jgi:2-C-methyl-D-erythritol 4-phosphate cytidylyltransferase
VWTIVVAGGTGRRFGRPKQYERLGSERVVDRSRRVAEEASDGVVLVVPADDVEREGGVAGGETRSGSVRAGLAAVPAGADVICVHDAARPFASPALYRAVVDAVVAGADGAVPGVPLADTVKVVDPSGVVVDTPDRSTLVAVQTPQAFRADRLRAAHAGGDEGTDDAGLVEALGGRVVVVPGEPDNRKLTHPDDLAWARAHLAAITDADDVDRPDPAGELTGELTADGGRR